MATKTVREIVRTSEEYLAGKGVDSPRLSAQVLVAFGLGMDRMRLFLELDRPLGSDELDELRPLIARRGRGEPVALIVGQKEFYCRSFTVTTATLVPRPETELLVEVVLERFSGKDGIRFSDLGTGSGILAVTLAAELSAARGLALDASLDALGVAKVNAERHGVADRLEFVRGDFTALPHGDDGYDVIVSNPPYVSEAEYAVLSREVRDFEPKGALVPGPSGLESYRAIAPVAFSALRPGGLLALEIGCSQAPGVRGILNAAGFGLVVVRRDLAGLDRVVTAVKP